MRGLLSRPSRWLLAAGLVYGVGLTAVTPPFQVPDEPAHFYRAYRVSEGQLDLIPKPGRSGADLPLSVQAVAETLRDDIPFHEEKKVAPRQILAALRVPLEPERRSLVWFGNSMQYPFLPYLPQALGIALGRVFGAPPLVLLYLARLANLIAGTLMVVFAVRRLPAFQWFAVMVALTPIAVFLRASASADVASTGAAFLLAAGVARLAWGEDSAVKKSDLVLLTASAVLLCASKAVYFPLAFLPVLIPASRFPRGRRAAFLLLHAAVSLAVTAWAVAVSRAVGTIRFEVATDPAGQIRDAMAHPLSFLQLVASDYVFHAPRYLAQFVGGQLGWLDTKLPIVFLLTYLAVLAALMLVDAGPQIEVRPWQRWILAGVTLSVLGLTSASQYALWTAYGARHIEGLQGRYFIPLAPAAVWLFHSRGLPERFRFRDPAAGLAAFSLLSFGVSVWALVARYYGG